MQVFSFLSLDTTRSWSDRGGGANPLTSVGPTEDWVVLAAPSLPCTIKGFGLRSFPQTETWEYVGGFKAKLGVWGSFLLVIPSRLLHFISHILTLPSSPHSPHTLTLPLRVVTGEHPRKRLCLRSRLRSTCTGPLPAGQGTSASNMGPTLGPSPGWR